MCYRTAEFTVCRCIRASFSPEILQAGAAKVLNQSCDVCTCGDCSSPPVVSLRDAGLLAQLTLKLPLLQSANAVCTHKPVISCVCSAPQKQYQNTSQTFSSFLYQAKWLWLSQNSCCCMKNLSKCLCKCKKTAPWPRKQQQQQQQNTQYFAGC